MNIENQYIFAFLALAVRVCKANNMELLVELNRRLISNTLFMCSFICHWRIELTVLPYLRKDHKICSRKRRNSRYSVSTGIRAHSAELVYTLCAYMGMASHGLSHVESSGGVRYKLFLGQ